MKKYITVFLILFLAFMVARGQENGINIIDQFVITDASVDGKDITPIMLEEGAFLVIYEKEGDDSIYFANIWKKAKSFSAGRIYGLTFEDPITDEKGHKVEELNFFWKYGNSYNNDKGTAKVKVITVQKPQGTNFKIVIVPEDLEILVYRGYVYGTLNLSIYEN